MKRRTVVGLVVLAVVLLVAGGLVWWMLSSSIEPTENQEASQVSTGSAASTTISEKEVATLQTQLNSRNKAEQARAFHPVLRETEWNPDEVLPPGATVVLYRQSFRAKDGVASMDAEVSGTATGKFLIGLTFEEGMWLIYEAKKAE